MIGRKPVTRHLAGVSLCLLALLLAALPAAASTGDRDASFGPAGLRTLDLGGTDKANGIAVDPNGSIVVAGVTNPSSGGTKLSVAMFKPNGALDTTFSGDGSLTTRFGFSEAAGEDVAIDSQGRIVVVGSLGSPWDVLVARFNKDGSNDQSFGLNGIVHFDASGLNGYDRLMSVAIQPADDKIVVAGWTDTASMGRDVLTARLGTDGTLDPAFASGGSVVSSLTPSDDGAYDVALAPSDGSVVIGGTVNGGAANLMVGKFTQAGLPDTSFSGDGIQVTDGGGNDEAYFGVDVSQSGQVVATGRTDQGGGYDSMTGKYMSTGLFDPSFNSGNPLLVPQSAGGPDELADVRFGPSGTMQAVGFGIFTGEASLTFLEVQFDGTVVAQKVIPATDGMSANAMTLQADGRILLAGALGNTDVLVGRLQGGCLQNYTYSGPLNGDWNTATNWTPSGVPDGVGKCATVTGGSRVDLTGTVTVTSLTLDAGSSIGGGGTLQIQSTMDWSGGVLNGNTETHILPFATVTIDGVVRIRGCEPPLPNCTQNHSIVNDGVTVLQPGGTIVADDGTSFINNGLFDIQSDGGYSRGFDDVDPVSDFFNNGLLRKSAEPTPSVPSIIEADFHNAGKVQVFAGDLQVWTAKKFSGNIDPGLDLSTGTTEDTVFPDGVRSREFATRVTNLSPDQVDMWVNEDEAPQGGPSGYEMFEFETVVEVQEQPDGIPADVRLSVDASLLTGDPLVIFNHGVVIPECPDLVTIDPDPCVLFGTNAEGDAVFRVRTLALGEFTSGNRPVFTEGRGGPGDAAPAPLPHAKKAPSTIQATVGEADSVTFTVDGVSITPSSGAPVLGAEADFVVTGGTAQDADVLGGTTGVPAPLFSSATDTTYRFPAGTFTIGDGGAATATAKIKPQAEQISAPDGHDIQVVWSSTAEVPNCPVCAFDVRSKFKADKKGAKWGKWKAWQGNTAEVTAVYTADGHGTYKFRSRVVNPQTSAASGWSPATGKVAIVH